MENYSWIKGFNYVPSYARNDIEFWRDYDGEIVEREMGYAKRIGFNCARVFLAGIVFQHQPEQFIENIVHFVRTAHQYGIYTIPCIWDSCFSEEEPVIDFDANEWMPNPGVRHLGEAERVWQVPYCDALIDALEQEQGLLMWDIHNEPWQTAYVMHSEGEIRAAREKEILNFVRFFCDYFHEHSKKPVTVGVAAASQLELIGEWCDVLSFHDYSPTWKTIEVQYDIALGYAEKWNKAVFCSEMCCPARCNPYDIAIEVADKKQVGYILWELMIGKTFWHDRHGIVYPDGTVRDPAIIAAVAGFYRKRGGGEIDYNVNTERIVEEWIAKGHCWLGTKDAEYEEGLEILYALAGTVESGNLVPLNILPTSQVAKLEKGERDRRMLRKLMLNWINVLQEDAYLKEDANYNTMEDAHNPLDKQGE